MYKKNYLNSIQSKLIMAFISSQKWNMMEITRILEICFKPIEVRQFIMIIGPVLRWLTTLNK